MFFNNYDNEMHRTTINIVWLKRLGKTTVLSFFFLLFFWTDFLALTSSHYRIPITCEYDESL